MNADEECDFSSSDSDAQKLKNLQCHIDGFSEILSSFEQSYPDWQIGVVLSLLKTALQSLRQYIDRDDEAAINWENPFVELQFPIELQCPPSEDSSGSIFTVRTGLLSAEGVVNHDLAASAMSRLAVKHLEILTLQDLTNGAALIKDGDDFRPVLPEEVATELDQIEDEEERELALRKFLQPLSFGAGTIDYGDLDLDGAESTEVPGAVLEQLKNINEPLICLPIEVDGHPLRLITIFEVHPMVADLESQSGYFPIIVGVALQYDGGDPECDWIEQPWGALETWSDQNREIAWDAIDAILEQLLKEQYFKDIPDVEEVLLDIKATVKVTVPRAGSTLNSSCFAQVTHSLGDLGDLTSLSVKLHPVAGQLESACRKEEWKSLLERMKFASSSREKGLALENLIKALFSSIPGFSVLPNIRTESEEIDLWIENNSQCPPFNQEGPLILAECKNLKKKAGKSEYVLLKEKALNRGGRCHLAFLISWKGFAQTVRKEMLRDARESLTIVPIDGKMIINAIDNGDFLLPLSNAVREAFTY